MKPSKIQPQNPTNIKVVGVGGSGGNAVSHMVRSGVAGVEFIAFNTDAQDLAATQARQKLRLSKHNVRGLGAGMDPDVGRTAAEESREEIRRVLKGADMVFVTCGLGGGTGSGAAPIVGEIARDLGALTIGVITLPFSFEGAQRARIANEALQILRSASDAVIAIPNDRLIDLADQKTSLVEAFAMADEILRRAVQGISDLITKPGLINLDFADVRAIMKDAGTALIGIGRAKGEDRAASATRAAMQSLILGTSIEGARGLLFNISGGADLTMNEVHEAAKLITGLLHQDAKVIFGTSFDEALGEEIAITIIASGLKESATIDTEAGSHNASTF